MDIEFLRNQWSFLEHRPIEVIREETLTTHHAAQYIAMVGKYLVEAQYDDSHTTMEWFPDLSAYLGNWIKGEKLVRVGFKQDEHKLIVLSNEFATLAELEIEGKVKNDVFDWLYHTLSGHVKHIELLKKELHYSVPAHPTDQGEPFRFHDRDIRETLCKYRSNAQWIITYFAKNHAASNNPHVWPHHFDTGCLIPVNFSLDNFPVKSYSLGLAIPDDMVDDYYFYVSSWKQDGDIDYAHLPELKYGQWFTQNWKGAVLPVGEIANLPTEEDQLMATIRFFETAIRTTLKLLK